MAHFYRRAFNFIRANACFGLIATNTIGQGDTRATGLRWICTHGGTIYAARKRYKWPGQAAVVVSVVWVAKSTPTVAAPFDLDGRDVPLITAYLFHAGGHETPSVLLANKHRSFIGYFLRGIGFTFDNTDTTGIASSVAEMDRLLAKDPRNAERIFPFIGGEEVNDSPTHAHHRFTINFGALSAEAAQAWPDLWQIVVDRVKPEREKLGTSSVDKGHKQNWWRFGNDRPELTRALQGLARVMVCPIVSNKLSFAFLHPRTVFSHKLTVFPFEDFAPFCILQSRIHECWVRLTTSTMKDDLNYSPSDCFGTFPFPLAFEAVAALEAAGREYYEFRARLMAQSNEGLTKTYNRFHDPEKASPDILRLRELHAAMDRAVLEAYGWPDLIPQCQCEFLLDYEDEDESDSDPSTLNFQPSTGRRKRRPWRYRWPDLVRDEVLARLLKLNAERAQEEKLAGLTAAAAAQPKRRKGVKTKRPAGASPAQRDLLPPPQKDFFG